MIARRATPADDALLSSIVMHPELRQWNRPDGAPDFDPTKYTAHPKSFAVVVEQDDQAVGCFLAFAIESKAYCIHTNLLPSCRGARAFDAAALALQWAFIETDAEQLTTMVPESHPAANWFAHSMGFRDTFKRAGTWLKHGKRYDMHYLRMDIDDWIQRLSMAPFGQGFHQMLAEIGGHVDHPDDVVHDAYVGTAWALAAVGRIDKGAEIYARYARTAGYQPFTVLAKEPLRIDIGNCVLVVDGERFRIEETAHA